MTKKQYIQSLSKEEFTTIVQQFHTKTDILAHFNVPFNGVYARLLNQLILKHGVSIQPKPVKYPLEEKLCPVCDSIFTTYIGRKDEKTTCSHSCSNRFFNGIIRNINPTKYTTICFRNHKKECIICGENRIVEVHHFDENHNNDLPENLIPLCPTHHRLFHSGFRKDVEPQIIQYQQNYLSSCNPTSRFIFTSG